VSKCINWAHSRKSVFLIPYTTPITSYKKSLVHNLPLLSHINSKPVSLEDLVSHLSHSKLVIMTSTSTFFTALMLQ